MTVFFMCSIKSPQCNRIAKKIVDSNFPSQCFDVLYHKLEISHPVGYKTMRPKTGDWEWLWCHFRIWSFREDRFLHFYTISWRIHYLTITGRKWLRNLFSVTITPSHLILVSHFHTPPEVKYFHVLDTSKHR